jgi:putative endonuclease
MRKNKTPPKATIESRGKNSLQQGSCAELQAAKYLQNRGWRVLESNFRTRLGEIDLIISSLTIVAFVEVRYRQSIAFGTPEETVTPSKRRKIVMAAIRYLQSHRWLLRKQIRFDVISITDEADSQQVLHIENAFDADFEALSIPSYL